MILITTPWDHEVLSSWLVINMTMRSFLNGRQPIDPHGGLQLIETHEKYSLAMKKVSLRGLGQEKYRIIFSR